MDFHIIGNEIRIRSKSPYETLFIGKLIGRNCKGGDVIALKGELGSGKTILAKGIAMGLGIKDSRAISSPSFTLINEFPTNPPFFHMDFHRITGPEEAEELGIREYLYGEGISAIEWPDRIMPLLIEGYLLCSLEIEERGIRKLSISAVGMRSEAIFINICKELKDLRILNFD